MEYSGFEVGGGVCDLDFELDVQKIGGEKNLTLVYHQDDPSVYYYAWVFETDSSWPTGSYTAVATITDNNSGETITESKAISLI